MQLMMFDIVVVKVAILCSTSVDVVLTLGAALMHAHCTISYPLRCVYLFHCHCCVFCCFYCWVVFLL